MIFVTVWCSTGGRYVLLAGRIAEIVPCVHGAIIGKKQGEIVKKFDKYG